MKLHEYTTLILGNHNDENGENCSPKNTKTTDPMGNATSYAYDKSNRLTKETDALKQKESYQYDKDGRITKLTDKAGYSTGYAYDNHGNVKTVTDKTGLNTQFDYDANDNLTKVTDAMGGVTTYGYDSMDWMTSYTNALGKTTEYTYDLEGNLTSRKDAAGRTEQFGYDESGKLTEYTAPSGKKISYDYDELNELIKKSYETAKGKKADDDVLYAYDAAGQRVSMTDAIGAAAYEYDALGRVTKAKDSAGQTVTYAYSESGNLQEMGYPDGTKVTYEYDLNDNLIKITDRQGAVTEYQYDALNRMVKTIRPNEIVTDVTYDALDHITKLVTSCAGCEEVLSTYEYTYNDQGYIISEKATESLAGYVYDDKHDGKHEDGKHDSEYPHGNKHNGKHDKDGTNAIRVVTTERSYEYDENWQLTKCTEKEENKGTTTYSYEYDSAGNRTAYEKVSKGETVEKYSYKYNDSNQLVSKTEKTDWRPWKHVKTTYEYDEDGNLISESSGKKDTKTYEYTVENHLKSVTTSNEVLMAALYDGDGNRLFTMDYVEDGKKSQKGQVLIPESAKTENGDSPAEQLADLVPKKNQEEYYSITQYVNDINRENAEVLIELKTDGTANAAYTYGYSRNSRDTSDGATYYLYDGRGSVSGLTSADGVTTNSYQYDPYGNTIFGTPVSINYYGYNGESTNTNTGYQYLRARYYNPANGNFTTEDTNTGTTENPLTRNRYGYVNNNPLNYIDPTGHSLWNRIKKGASNLFNSAKNAITNIGKKIASTASNLFNKAVNTVSNIAKSVAKGVSSLARKASGLISGAAKAVRSGLNLAQKTAKTVASAAARTAINISAIARQGYKAAKGYFSSFNSYVSYRTAEIKAVIKRILCSNNNFLEKNNKGTTVGLNQIKVIELSNSKKISASNTEKTDKELKASKLIADNASYIKRAAEYYKVDPNVVAGVIYSEQVNNVNIFDTLTDWVSFYGVIDMSVGIGQVRLSTAELLEEKGYVKETKADEGGWKIPIIGTVHGTTTMAREKRLEDPKMNITYVAAYIKLIEDTWKKDFPEIGERPDILGTLYNQGHDFSTPHANPGSNEFGEFVKENYNTMEELLNS